MTTDATTAGTPEGAVTGTPEAKPGDATTPTETKTTFSADDVKSQVSAAVNAALKAERDKQAALLADVTKDSESKLAELTARSEQAQQFADFVSEASAAGIRNLKAAYKVAKDDYINSKGKLDLAGFRKDNPEFFASTPDANAGAGAGHQHKTGGMNAAIRAAAGVR